MQAILERYPDVYTDISPEQTTVFASIQTKQHCLIQGCAGSRKTDTLVKAGLRQFLNGKSVMFVTKIGSVTDEIMMRVAAFLKVKRSVFKKRGGHYIYSPKNTLGDEPVIEIANVDAAIHWRLEAPDNDIDLDGIGDLHDHKASLIANHNIGGIQMKVTDRRNPSYLLVDEIQDFARVQLEALTTMLTLGQTTIGIAAGDYLQTVFDASFESEVHPMDLFRDSLSAKVDYLTICWRCTVPMIRVINVVLQPFFKASGCLPLRPKPTPVIDMEGNTPSRPILFTHGPLTTNNTTAMEAASRIFSLIVLLMKRERDLHLRDFFVCATKVRDSPLFIQLENLLNTRFKTRAAIILDATETGERKSISWDYVNTVNAVRLLSIHSAKGRDAKVCIFPGVTDESLPKKDRLFHLKEEVDRSLLCVGTSRATRHLFIGMSNTKPSRYMRDTMDNLLSNKNSLAPAVASWDELTWKTDHERECCKALNSRGLLPYKPANAKYLMRKLYIPARYLFHPSDVENVIKGPRELYSEIAWKEPEITHFGKAWCISETHDDRFYPLVFGVMGQLLRVRQHFCPARQHSARYKFELAVSRHIDAQASELSSHPTVFYTTDEYILNVIADLRLNEVYVQKGTADWTDTLRTGLNPDGLSSYSRAILKKTTAELEEKGPGIWLDEIFSTDTFHESLTEFLSDSPSNTLTGQCLWRVALFHMSLFQRYRRGIILSYMDQFNDNISGLHDNIVAYASLRCPGESNFEQGVGLRYVERNASVLESLGSTKEIIMGITGSIDEVRVDREIGLEILEIKVSSASTPRPLWLAQVLLYACIYKEVPKIITVVNLAEGVEYRWMLPDEFREHRKGVVRTFFQKALFKEEHIGSLLQQLKEHRPVSQLM